MKYFKKILAWVLCISMVLPTLGVYAQGGEEYTITNGYITYSFHKETGGFSIDTDTGHPQKSFDDHIPLLYKEDKDRSNGTSFVSVRIDDKDYIFGQDYSFFKIASNLEEPVITEEGRLISIAWTIDDITVIKKVALGTDMDSDLTGNAGIAFEVINNSDQSHDVGIRLLLDTALGNMIDAPYVVVDEELSPTMVEKEFTGENVPAQIRNVDSLTNYSSMSYLITKGWTGGIEPNRVVVGHWANIANTKYDYTPNKYCDFTNYSNSHGTPDSSMAVYWEQKAIAPGAGFKAETLYGVGNFSESTKGRNIGLNVTAERVELSSDGKSYQNNGEINVTVEIDNTLDTSNKLTAALLQITFDEKDFEAVGSTKASFAVIEKEVKTLNFKLRALTQAETTAGEIYASITATETLPGGTQETTENMTERSVILPSVKGLLPDIQMNAVHPKIVYYGGEKAVTVTGNMKGFDVLAVNDGWDLRLYHTGTGDSVLIEKRNVSFLDDAYTAMSFSTKTELSLGEYEITFDFTDPLLVSTFGKSITAAETLMVSDDPYYALKSYGLVALVRSTDNHAGNTSYDVFTFRDEGQYQAFYDGQEQGIGQLHNTAIKYNFGENIESIGQHEILITARGDFREMEKVVDESTGQKEKYWQADMSDGDIIINNILSYEGDQPLEIFRDGRDYVVEGDGLLKVVNSVNVWRSEWKIQVSEDFVYSLEPERAAGAGVAGNIYQLELSLEGAGTMVQSLGGFLIDMHYGVLSSEFWQDGDGRLTYGIGFGGRAAIPIKDDSSPEEHRSGHSTSTGTTSTTSTSVSGSQRGKLKRKSTGLTDGTIVAEIGNVMFGENGKLEDGKVVVEDTGFIGIDTTVGFGVPRNMFGSLLSNQGGMSVNMRINTIENIYQFNLGISVKVFECEVVVGFKQVNVKKKATTVPDTLAFHIRQGLAIPIGPPATPVYLTGLGGGIENLADTIGGNYVSKLPPVTILASMRLQVIGILVGDFEARINFEGLALTGEMSIHDRKELVDISAGFSARWANPWSINMYGNISVLDGIIQGGLTVTIAEDYFYGYIFAGIFIPESIPVVGGRKLAGVEAAASHEFIGANVEIIGFKYGVIYYWGENVKFSDSIDLSPPAQKTRMMLMSNEAVYEDYDAENDITTYYGTNVHQLTGTETVSSNRLTLYGSNEYQELSAAFADAEKQDNLLFDISYTGADPKSEDLILVNPDGQEISMVEDDGNGGGNFILKREDATGNHIYISVTDKSYIKNGAWTLKYKNAMTPGKMKASGVDDISDLTALTHSYQGNFKFDVNWTATGDLEDATSLDIYLTKDKDILEKIKTSNNQSSGIGDKLLHLEKLDEIKAGTATIEIPDTYENGTYYAVAMLSTMYSAKCVMAPNPIQVTNPNLPNDIKSVKVSNGGNGNLYVEIEDAENANYNAYLVEVVSEDGTYLKNNLNQYDKGDKQIYIGKDAQLVPGEKYYVRVRTLREERITPQAGSTEAEEVKFYYGTGIVKSESIVAPEVQKPKLLKVETSFDKTKEFISETNGVITYTFDRPVYLDFHLRGQNYYYEEAYQEVWKIELEDLEDGDYIADFTATTQGKDSVTGEECEAYFPDARLGFTVDSSKPILSLSQKEYESVDKTKAAFGTNVILANADGTYTIEGISENGIELTVDDKKDGLSFTSGSTFVYQGKLAEGELSKEHTLKAVDKAGNESGLYVTVLNGEATSFERLILLVDGKEVDKATGTELTVSKSADLTAVGVTKAGKRFEIPDEQVEFSVLYPKNTAYISDGTVTAYLPGETAIKAKLVGATVTTASDTEIKSGLEDYAIINIRESTKEDLKKAIENATTVLANGVDKPASARDTLQTEINKAQGVHDDPQATGRDYTVAIKTLNDAVIAFNNATGSPGGGSDGGGGGSAAPIQKVTGKAGVIYSFQAPGSGDTKEYVPYYKMGSEKVYVKISAYMNGNLYFIAPIDTTYYLEERTVSFNDTANHWAKKQIGFNAARDIFQGTAPNIFQPDGNMTRGMFVTILGRMSGVEADMTGESSFGDVPAGMWYTPYVVWAAENGIVTGYDADRFGPEDLITREQMCAMIDRYLEKQGYVIAVTANEITFADDGLISPWAEESVEFCRASGLVVGKENNLFAPQDYTTRAEAATLMQRLITKILETKIGQ